VSILRRWWDRITFRYLLWQMDRWAIEDHKAGLHVRPAICKLCGEEYRAKSQEPPRG
jgi:hypothetical protein